MSYSEKDVQILINGEKFSKSEFKLPINGFKDVEFLKLWDIYRGLLTSTQSEISDLYFNCDLSLSEIAEQKGISRQAVSDCLKSCKKQLEEFDAKLNFSRTVEELSLETSFIVTGVRCWAEVFRKNYPDCGAQLDVLLSLLDKDYSAEIAKALNEKQ